MKTYTLTKRDDDRVVLALEGRTNHPVIQTVVAKTWCDARAKINEKGLYQFYGFGWFLT
jgi:hypothetical protein